MKSIYSRLISALLISILTIPFTLHDGYAQDFNPNIFVELSKKTIPSVVNIQTVSKPRKGFGRGQGPNTNDELFRRFFGDIFRDGQRRGLPQQGPDDGGEGPGTGSPGGMALGTGFIIDPNGLILTNNHVVAGADEIKIIFTEELDEKPTDAKVVGRDPDLDLALIKVETKRQLVPVVLGDSDSLQVGEYVYAVGNPFGQGHSVTHGIISAKGRKSPDFALASYLQTDAPINPGNSGGPLLNLKGEVIGINNAIDARAQGIGFAIPVNFVKGVLPQLKSNGSVSRGYIGIQVNDLTPEIANRIEAPKDIKGCFVAHVYPGEPADKSGLKAYDIITEVSGKKISSANDLILAVTGTPVGVSTKVKAIRAGKEKEFILIVALRPNSKPEEKNPQPRLDKEDFVKKLSGLQIEDLTLELSKEIGTRPNTKGVVVTEIRYGSPADKASILRGDIIVEVDRKPIKTADDFYRLLKAKKSYLLRVLRVDESGQEAFQVLILDLK